MEDIVPADSVSKVFISYSRKDADFTYKIVGELKKTGVDILIDNEDIEKLEPWWERITNLIDQANTVIFIVSINWLHSETCKKEFNYAENSSKKLCPIIYRPVGRQKLPNALERLNWLNFKEDTSFTEWVGELYKLLIKDLDWIREHTRLGEAALFWTKHDKQNSDLLKAVSLLTAERWLSQKPADAPPPSAVLADFLKVSRDVWEEEERAKQQMIEGVMISQSKLLAEQSRQIAASGDATTAVLLALEALPDPGSGNSRPLIREAEIACYNGLSNSREEHVFNTGHKSPKFAITPDGTILLTGSGKGTDIWDIETGKITKHVDGDFTAFSENGIYIISVNAGRQLIIWNTETQNIIMQLAVTYGVEKANFNEEKALVGVLTSDNMLYVWDLKTGTELCKLETNSTNTTRIFLIPDGKHLVIAGENIKLINIKSGKKVGKVKTGYEKIAVSMASYKIATTARFTIAMPTDVYLWDIKTGKKSFTLSAHESRVSSVKFSPDGKLLVTISVDQTTRVWEVATGKILQVLRGHKDAVTSCSFDKTGLLLVTSSYDNNFIVWNLTTGQPVATLKGHFGHVNKSWSFKFWRPYAKFNFDDSKIITSWNDYTVRIWSIVPIGLSQSLRSHKDGITGAYFHPSGKWFATSSKDKTIIIWDARTMEIVKTITAINAEVNDVAVSPDGKMLAGISDDMTYIIDTSSFKVLKQIKSELKHANNRSVRFSPESDKLLVVDDFESKATVFSLPSGKSSFKIEASAWLYSGEFSPNGSFIATTGDERAVRFWNTDTGKEVSSVLLGHPSSVYTVAFNRSGTRIVIALDNLYSTIWTLGTDMSKPGSLIQLAGHDKEVLYAEFSPDEKKVVTASTDHKIRIFDSNSGELISVLEGHRGPVLKAVFSPEGEQIVSISDDNTIRVWNIFSTAETLAAYAKKAVPRLLTPEQRDDLHLTTTIPNWYLESGKWPYDRPAK